jgi:hypothetical protein
MNRINVTILLIVFVFSVGCKTNIKQPTNQNNNKNRQTTLPSKINNQNINNHVNAYYFHGNVRCRSCHLIETMTKDVIQNSFKNNLVSKTLKFKVVNIEEAENKHFIKDYELYSKAIVLTLIKDNKEVRHKNLEKVWSYLGNENKFKNYIESEVQTFLKETK